MNDFVRDILKDDNKLLRSYEQSEARYLYSLKDKYCSIDLNLEISDEEFAILIKTLAKYHLCFDEWLTRQLEDYLIKDEMEKIYEKTGKHTENMED